MKWNELRRIAESKGWKLYRRGAGHDVYHHPDHPGVVVYIGRHGKEEIRPGTFDKLKKQIGL